MYLTKSQVDSRLKSSLNVEQLKRVATQGRRQSREEKILVGVLAKFDTQDNIAKTFGTSHQNVSLNSRGMLSNTKFDPSLRREIDEATPKTEKVSDKALEVLMDAIGVVKETVGTTKKATEASVVARNMAAVYRDMRPGESGAAGSKIQININAPNQRKESEFETLEVITA